jgi:hypothetical protein
VTNRWRRALAMPTVAWLASTLWGGLAWGGSGRVVLVRPAEVDDTIAEALNRMRGELVAEGFDVSEVEALPQPPPLSAGGEGPAADAPLATIDLSVEEGADVVDLRVIDQLTNKTVIRRTPVERGASSHTAEVLAVRAVELLRASLLELLLESRPSEPAARAPNAEATHASKWAAQGLPREREPVWGVEAGAIVLADFGGIPPAVLGLARVRRTVFGPLALRATVAGLGTQPRVESGSLGSATVAQDIGLLECVVALWDNAIVHPVVSLGAGALYTSVDGHASYPYQARARPTSAWAAAADGSLGVEVRVGRHFSLSLEGHALLAKPFPVVQFLGSDVARNGQPSVLGSASVGGWL